MVKYISAFAFALIQTCASAQMPPQEWRPTTDGVRIADGFAIILSKDSKGGIASAAVDLTPYANDAVLVSVRGEAKGVSLPPKPWNGVKAMLSFRDAATGQMRYISAMNGRTGTFGPETFHVYCDFRGKEVREGVMSLGLENVSGEVCFDLRTFAIKKIDRAEYSPRWRNLRQLKGVMLPHNRPLTDEDFATLKGWGVNLARFQMVRNVREESSKRDLLAFDRWLDIRMEWLERALELGRKYGILLIVDMHSTPGEGSGAMGNHGVFEPGPWAAHYLEAWRVIATRFKGRKGIYAFDLVNEPHNPDPRTEDCWNLQYKAAEIIRGIDPETPISVESEWGDLPKPFEWMCPLPFTNIIYQVHMYAPSKFTHQRVGAGRDGKMDYPGTLDDGTMVDREWLRRELQPVRDFQLRYGARILVGEFSAAIWAKGADRWLADVISIFNEYGWDWTYHAFREAECWSLEHEGTSWDDVRPSADNPRKRAVLDGMKAAAAAEGPSLVVRGDPVAPVSVATNGAGHLVFDFGKHGVGWVEVDAQVPGEYDFIWGELVDESGCVQTNEFYTKRQGTIRCAHTKGLFGNVGWMRIPYEAEDDSAFNAAAAGSFGKVMPFRWLEVIQAPFDLKASQVRQVPIYYPYDISESSFECDNDALNCVYGFCKHSIRATTYMGMFIDGDRERLPYEADSYIAQLGTYAVTSDDTLVRRTIDHLSSHTTWPTEWKQFFIRMVYEDWQHSGKTDILRKHYDLMKNIKAWRNLRRDDGLLVTPGETMRDSPDGGKFRDIVDWAKCYRDGFVFTDVNAVVNALHYRNLKELSEMARAIGKPDDAMAFEAEARQTFNAYQRVFFDSAAGRYRDGEGTDHATVQGNAMALACGIVPPENVKDVADYVVSRGFSCSTYMAQFVLEALFASGRDDDALRLMTGSGERSWLGMMAKGATITMEFWDLTMEEKGRVPDMNHAWSTAPLNMINRYVLGLAPLTPGFSKVRIAPQPGSLSRVAADLPTPRGAIREELTFAGQTAKGRIVLPKGVEGVFVWRGIEKPLVSGVNDI